MCGQTALGPAGSWAFPAVVPRERWVHLALVAQRAPNRLTLLLDGLMVGQARDVAFPLPMKALGGAPSPLAFQVCVCVCVCVCLSSSPFFQMHTCIRTFTYTHTHTHTHTP